MKTILFFLALLISVPFYGQTNPPVTTVSFQLIRKLIIVNATVSGNEGLFILDTGVPDVTLNNRFFKGFPTGEKFYGVNGCETEKEIDFIRINLAGFEKKITATLTDFNALERTMGMQLMGVIGNNLFKNCEVVLDYTFGEVTIYQLDKKGNCLASKQIHQRPLETLSFSQGGSEPFLQVTANGQCLKMGLDSGASANVIDNRKTDLLNACFSRVMNDSLTSFGHETTSVKSLTMHELMVGGLSCPPMKTLIVSLDHLNQNRSGARLDGLLGYEFLSNFRVAINFRKKEIYLWDRKTVDEQLAAAGKTRDK